MLQNCFYSILRLFLVLNNWMIMLCISDKIIVGSYQGILRIFNPRTKKTEDGCGGFSVDDLVLEQVLHQPILQLEAGRFSS